MLILAVPQIYTCVFHFQNFVDLGCAWAKDSRPYQFSFLLRILARLVMRHTRVFGTGIPHDTCLTV